MPPIPDPDAGHAMMESPLPNWWLVAARLHRQLVAEIPKAADRQAVLFNLLSLEAQVITAPQPAPGKAA